MRHLLCNKLWRLRAGSLLCNSNRRYSIMAEPLVPLPAVEKLSDRVIRVLGGNPGKFTLQGTNTYIIGTGPKRILIDTGEGKPEWLSTLKTVLTNSNITITDAFLTHWHHDHIGGVSDLLSHSPSTRVHKRDPEDNKAWKDIPDKQTFSTEGATLTAFHCPGHTTDHTAFILLEENAMFTADNVLGQGTAVFEDLATYMNSLNAMSKHPQFTGRAYPGHGPVIEDGPGKVREYIAHRKQREKQVLDVLATEREDGKGWTSMEIVKVIYKGYPKDLWAPAERGILQILDKLKKEGKVVKDDKNGTWSLSGSEKAAL